MAPVATDFASAERDSASEIEAAARRLSNNGLFIQVLNAFPIVAFVLNEKRQLLFGNRAAETLFRGELPEFLGRRPGEAIGCLHAEERPGGCGTTIACRFCGAVTAILEAQRSGGQVQKETRISLRPGAVAGQALELLVTATPFLVDERPYLVVTFEDLSDRKRRELLERIFFHDVLNSIAALQSGIELLRQRYGKDEYFPHIVNAAEKLQGEVLRQRELLQLETGELCVSVTELSSRALLQELVAEYSPVGAGGGISLRVNEGLSRDFSLEADEILLRRVLGNMVKNALEASQRGEEVLLAAQAKDGSAIFRVSNPAVIPPADQLQIFQRSFSTKGKGRGIGTYSMRLITERYLGGRVGFESREGVGTSFWVRLPLRCERKNN